ncbi:MAG: NDP-hexose-3-ketoreductase [Planctomycetota bacterium]|jgi:NDP-hexose-3-ketoreductase
MKKVRFGIIGCGNITRKFAPAFKESSYAELIAISSRSAEKAKEYSSLFECEGVVGYDSLLERSDIDAVYIATPTGTHMEWCLKAARKGKHILCEKTLAVDEQQVLKILECCEKENVSIFEGFAYQFHPQHDLLRDLIEDGSIGKPKCVEAKFGFPLISTDHRYDPSLGGGSLLDAGAYTIHMARKVFEREPIEVHSTLDTGREQVDIFGAALLNFGKGQTAQLVFGFNYHYRNCCSIWGTEGLIELERVFSVPDTHSARLIHSKQDYRKEYNLEPYSIYLGEIDNFCINMDTKISQKKWGLESLLQIRVLDAVRNSAS